MTGGKTMKGYYITGSKGSYIELEDGRMADTVIGATHPPDLGDAHEVIEVLKAEMTHACREPLYAEYAAWELASYVGAQSEREESLPAIAEMTGIPYNTLARYAREGRFIARKSGGVWLSTLSAVNEARIKPRTHPAPQPGGRVGEREGE